MIIRYLLPILAAFLLTGCNPGAQIEDARDQIKQFQADYNAGDVEALYRKAGDRLRSQTSMEQMEGTVALFSARLGKIESSEQTGFNAGFHNGVTTTTVVMKTRFAQGEGSETYIFEGSGDAMKLAGWTVNSPLLTLSAADVKKLTEAKGESPPVQVIESR